MGKPRNPTRAPGGRIGDYRIERELRAEASGVVHVGVHLVLPRRAAVKVMHFHPSVANQKTMALQMLREACILEALHHPGAPRVFECGVLPDKRTWVALELVEGQTIAEAIADAPLGVPELVEMIRAIADILEHAHARGVVHHQLSEQVIVCTPDRASPVCLRGWGDVVTHDSTQVAAPSGDVYALGAVAFRALTGHALDENSSAQRQAPTAPVELSQLIDDMLMPDTQRRPIASEVYERATWLAEAHEPATPRPRATPRVGLHASPAPGPVSAPEVDAPRTRTADFSIRIHRP